MTQARWRPPWPPIQVASGEWVLMRDDHRKPAAIVRALRMGPRQELFYRVVTWQPTSEGRELIGYYPTLDEADQAVLFVPEVIRTELQPNRQPNTQS